MIERVSTESTFNRARASLSRHLSSILSTRSRTRLLPACAIIFLVAFGVRLLYWQDMRAQIKLRDVPLMGMTMLYEDEALRMREQGGILFPNGPVDPGDARMIAHPPGYPMLMAAAHAIFGEQDTALKIFHVLVDAAAAVLVLLVAAELLPAAVAIIAGTLVALSPHFAYYSMLLMPDSLAGIPILLAVYFIIRASKRRRLIAMIAAGALVGCSCWLRSNALLLAPFLGIVILLLFERRRLAYSAAFVGTALAVIAPITIRNWVVYDHFVPVSLGAGVTLMKGIADYAKDKRFGLPLTDAETVNMEAEWYGRPDYARHLWVPDGVQRDRDRFARGAAIVREHPGWFFTVMLNRMAFMLRYNDFSPQNILHNTTRAPTVSPTPNFGHDLSIPDGAETMWASSPVDFIQNGLIISPQAEASLVGDPPALQIAGDDSQDGSVFASAPIPVAKNTDYMLKVLVNLDQGPAAIKVHTADPRIMLALRTIPEPDRKAIRRARKGLTEPDARDSTASKPGTLVEVPFASGDATEVRVVFSNYGMALARPIVRVSHAEMFALGPTPFLWTRYPRAVIGGVQKNLFKTQRMLTLIGIGMLLLILARCSRALAILLAVPVYYLCTQSFFHTEYRYILVIHYFLFVVAAVALYAAGIAFEEIARWFKANYWPDRDPAL